MKIFMTGATGFIGSHVAFRLLQAGHAISMIARNPDKVPQLSSHPRVKRFTATLYDYDVIRTALIGCDACVHVALGWGDTPLDMLQSDTTATVSLLANCLEAKLSRFLYTSSTAALGPFLAEMCETDPLAPTDYYGATKAASEAYVLAVASKSAMRCNVIRPGYTFGNPVVPGAPMQSDPRLFDIVRRAKKHQEIVLLAGDGTQFVSAPDLARLFEAVLCSSDNREIYYGLGADFVSWESIARKVIALTGSSSTIRLTGSPTAPCLFSLGKIRDKFGFTFDAEPYLSEHLEHLIATLND